MSFFHRIAVFASCLLLVGVPVCARAAGEASVTIAATDQMKFDTTDVTGKVGQKLTIKLINEGSMPKTAMAHNLILLQPGTDVAAFVASASKRAGNEYLPGDDQASRMLVHTQLLGPGEEDTISFTPTAPGVYEYVCTFPGHLVAGMRGQITVQ